MSSEVADEAVELSIGEVLELLVEEFPDVTISKIRFLESQGLIQPGRTPSGYRRFNGPDVDRLRWILHQQRDHFLPLKIIRQMLDDGVDRYVDANPAQPTLWSRSESDADTGAEPADVGDPDVDELRRARSEPQRSSVSPGPTTSSHPAATTDPAPVPSVGHEPSTPASEPGGSAPVEEPPTRRRPLETPADLVAALQEDPRPRSRPAPPRAPLWADRPEHDQPTMTAEELCAAAGVDADLLADLERFGLVRAAQRAGETFYGSSALEVAVLAGRASVHGITARHLRMYLVSAEREAGFIEQLAVPLLKQRNPTSRAAAVELSSELAALGADLHAALLRRELGPALGETPGT